MSITTETKQLEKCNTILIKEGDILSRTSYMIVGKKYLVSKDLYIEIDPNKFQLREFFKK